MLTQHIHKMEIQEIQTNTPPAWEQLVEQSPELYFIKQDATRILSGMPRDFYFWQHYESLKRRMKSNVGWNAHPGLPEFVRTADAYDLAYREIFGRYV